MSIERYNAPNRNVPAVSPTQSIDLSQPTNPCEVVVSPGPQALPPSVVILPTSTAKGLAFGALAVLIAACLMTGGLFYLLGTSKGPVAAASAVPQPPVIQQVTYEVIQGSSVGRSAGPAPQYPRGYEAIAPPPPRLSKPMPRTFDSFLLEQEER
jgi:hypothetical protein